MGRDRQPPPTIWFARDFSSEAARGVLIATCIADVVSFIMAAMGTLAGTMNAWGKVAVLIYLFSKVVADIS